MLTLPPKLRYLIDSAVRYHSKVACPSCDETNAELIERKYIFTRLFRCKSCELLFRHPIDSETENNEFYQSSYTEGDGITTFLPEQDDLDALLRTGFSDECGKNAGRLKELFSKLFTNLDEVKIIDYGASWGYISYQLKSFGLDVESFEISVPRAEFGNRSLGLSIKTSPEHLRNENDIFFSSHVIEHVPSVSAMLRTSAQLVHRTGYVITLCPNGSKEYRKRMPYYFSKAWGKVHPSVLTADYFQKWYRNVPYFIATRTESWDAIIAWNGKTQLLSDDLSGSELCIVALPNVQI